MNTLSQGALNASKNQYYIDSNSFDKKSSMNNAINDTFMKVLFTQLQMQSPMDPFKSKDMLAHMGMMSQITQSMELNNKMDKLIDINSNKYRQNPNISNIGKSTFIPFHYSKDKNIYYKLESYPKDQDIVINIIDKNKNIIDQRIIQGSEAQDKINIIQTERENCTLTAYYKDTLEPISILIKGKITAVNSDDSSEIFIDNIKYKNAKIKIISN